MRLAFAIALLCAVSPALSNPLDDFRAEAVRAEADADQSQTSCVLESARSVSFAEIVVNSAFRHGECVTVRGVLWGNMMFATPDFLYLADRFDIMYAGRRLRTANPFRIGIQRHEVDGPDTGTSFYGVEVTGIVTDCGVDLDRSNRVLAIRSLTSDQLFVSTRHDFCGWYGSSVAIDPTDIRYGDRRNSVRHYGEENARYVSIWQIPQTAPIYEMLEGRSRDFLSSVERGELPLVDEMGNTGWGDEVDRFYAVWYSDRLQGLRNHTQQPAVAHFWTEIPTRHGNSEFDLVDRYVWTCYCLDGDCSESWPISRIDTLPSAEQPYLCIPQYLRGESLETAEIETVSSLMPFGGYGSPFAEAQ